MLTLSCPAEEAVKGLARAEDLPVAVAFNGVVLEVPATFIMVPGEWVVETRLTAMV
jgi:hypothetical protein